MSEPLPFMGLMDGIAESSAAITPIKTALAFFVRGPLQRIQPLDVIDHGSHALCELSH